MVLQILGFPKELDQIVCSYVSHDISFWFTSVISNLGISDPICDFYNSGKIAAGSQACLLYINGLWRFENTSEAKLLSSFDKTKIDWESVYVNARSEEDFCFIDTFHEKVSFSYLPVNTNTPTWFVEKHRIGGCIQQRSRLTIGFIKQNEKHLHWYQLCANQHLSNEMLKVVVSLMGNLNTWRSLSQNKSLHFSFFEKHLDKCYLPELTANPAVPLSFVESHLLLEPENQYLWQRRPDLTSKFLNQHADAYSFVLLSQNPYLPIDFVTKNQDRLRLAVKKYISSTNNGSCFLRKELFEQNVDYIHLEAILGWSSTFSVDLFDHWIDLKIGQVVDYQLKQGEIFYASQEVISEKFLNRFADQLNWELIFNHTNVPVSVLHSNFHRFPTKPLNVNMMENLIKVMEYEMVPLVKKILLR